MSDPLGNGIIDPETPQGILDLLVGSARTLGHLEANDGEGLCDAGEVEKERAECQRLESIVRERLERILVLERLFESSHANFEAMATERDRLSAEVAGYRAGAANAAAAGAALSRENDELRTQVERLTRDLGAKGG
jgi:hypothetical protein